MPKTGWEESFMSMKERAVMEASKPETKDIDLSGSELIFYDLLEEKLDRIIYLLERQGSVRAG